MQPIFEQNILIPPSACDYSGRLGYAGAFAVLMDLATEHAERLGIGLAAMKAKNRFWVTVRTKIIFHERPAVSEAVRLITWPEKPGAVRCNRSYEIRRGDKLLIAGRTEWAVMNTEANAIAPAADLFPADLDYASGSSVSEPFVRIPARFDGTEPFASYTVRSTDIDLGGHMNNAAYPRALFGAFSAKELEAMQARSIDLIFRAPCYEGEKLDFYKKESEGVTDLRIARGDETVLLARIAR
ncbi:MAG: hypothetical protein IJV51_06740 [Oscillospiraceae bacterium]|nr:hypothetical protein [Oscillospiraceae bacterium]